MPAPLVDFTECLPHVLTGGPTGARARLLGRIVAAATAVHGGVTTHSAIRCRKRPQGRPCTGHLLVRRQDLPAEIQWGCPECRERGRIRGFHDAPQDLSGTRPELEPEVEVVLREAEYRALEGILTLGPLAERLVMAAAYTPFGIRLSGRLEDLDALLEDLSAAALDPELGLPAGALDRAVLTLDRGRRAP